MFRAETYLSVSLELQFKSTFAAVCMWHIRDVTWIADILGRGPSAWHAERLKARGMFSLRVKSLRRNLVATFHT